MRTRGEDDGARPSLAVVGGLWALAAWGLGYLSCPGPVRALVLAEVPWLATGFLHLDGYMDVCDAVLSRRDLATRQKILKDLHCGAFAVISGAFVYGTWSPVSLRGDSGTYAAGHDSRGHPGLCRPGCGVSAAYGDQSICESDRRGQAVHGRRPSRRWLFGCGIALIRLDGPGCAPLAARRLWTGGLVRVPATGRHVRDISGFALTLGELAGVAVLTLTR
ncbi:MAG: adenosylcobinamide-GDP ribazoletransferase [Oscillospiraceae bacterium]